MIENISSNVDINYDSAKAEKGIKKVNTGVQSLLKNVQSLTKEFTNTNKKVEQLGLNYRQFLGMQKTVSSGTPFAQTNKTQSQRAVNNLAWGYPDTAAINAQAAVLKQQEKNAKNAQYVADQNDKQAAQQRKNTEQLINSQERLNNVLGITQARIMANYVVFNQLSNSLRFVLNYTVQLDDEMRSLQSIARISDSAMSDLKDTIIEVSNASRFTSLEVAKTTTVLAQAGLSLTQIKGALPAISQLAIATGTDLNTATDVVTSALNIYTLQVTEATQVTNALTTAVNESKADISGFQYALQYAGNFAAQLGVTYQEQAALVAAATQAGIRSKSMLGTGQRAVFSEFIKPTPKLLEQLQKVGLSLEDIDIKSRGLIPVLKSLRDSGFSASDAFQSMDRRGASFLASVLTQTDFIDELTYKMSLSTAASEAAEKRMESLSSQWLRFQSAAGSAASVGLEPMVLALKEILKVVNDVISSTAGGGILAALFGAGATTASLGVIGLVAVSLGNIVKQMKELQKVSKTGGLLGGLINLPLGKLTLWIAGISAAASVVYALTKNTSLWLSELDKTEKKVGELSGELEELGNSTKIIDAYIVKLTQNTKKFGDRKELSKLTAEIITRFPEMSKHINTTNTSIEELLQTLQDKKFEIGAQSIEKLTEKLKELRNQARETAKEELFKREDKGFWSNIFSTQTEGDVVKFNVDKVKERASLLGLDLSEVGDFSAQNNLFERGRDYDKRISESISELTKEIEAWAQRQDSPVSALANFRGLGLDRTIEVIQNRLLTGTARQNQVTGQLISENDPFQKNISDLTTSVEKATESYNTTAYAMAGVSALGNPKERARLERTMMSDLNTMLAVQKSLALPEGSLEERALFASGGDQDNLTKLVNNIVKETGFSTDKAYQKIIADYEQTSLTLLDKVSGFIEKAATKLGLDSKSYKQGTSGLDELIISNIKVLRNTLPGKEQDELVAKTEQLINMQENQLYNKYNLVKGETYGTGSKELSNLQQTEMSILRYRKLLTSAVTVTASEMERLEMSLEVFFKKLSAGVNEAETAFETSMAGINKITSQQQGKIAGLEQRYGSGSIIAGAASIKARTTDENLDPARLAATRSYRDSLMSMLTILQNDPRVQELAQKQQAAQVRKDTAAVSGDRAGYLAADKELNDLARSMDKASKEEAELTKQINELDGSIYELTNKIGTANAAPGSGWGQITSGAQAATTTYVDQNKQYQFLDETTAEFTLKTIEDIEGGFTEMFTSILDGSKSASEAFKDFGLRVIETIRDIATEMAVKSVLTSLFSLVSSGGGQVEESGGMTSSGSSTAKKAQGGLISGPIKNRDSVKTLLMPGEYVLKKSAVDTLGTNFLDGLNNNSGQIVAESNQTISAASTSTTSKEGTGSGQAMNIWVVLPEEKPVPGDKDIVYAVSQDLRKGGTTKQLVRQIALGV